MVLAQPPCSNYAFCHFLQQKDYDLVMDEEIQFVLIDSVAGSRDDKVFLYQNVGTTHIQEVNFQDAEVLSAEERKKMDIAQVGLLTVNAICNVMDIMCTVEWRFRQIQLLSHANTTAANIGLVKHNDRLSILQN